MDVSPLRLKRPAKKRKLVPGVASKCVICKEETMDSIRKASPKGIQTFLRALLNRKENGDSSVKQYFESLVEYGDSNEPTLNQTGDMFWHKSCYSTFTSKYHINRFEDQKLSCETVVGPSSSKRPKRIFDWKELCLFCEQKSFKKDKTLLRVVTDDFCKTLEQRAREKGDIDMDSKVGSYRKLIHNGAKYHKACHSRYIKKHYVFKDENLYNEALVRLMDTILPELKAGKAFLITDLVGRYSSIMKEIAGKDDLCDYSANNLKRKIEKQYSQDIRIVTSESQGKPNIVVHRDLKLDDAINTAAKLKHELHLAQIIRTQEASSSERDFPIEASNILYHAALILRNERKQCKGIETQPLNPADICLEREQNVVSDKMYSFMSCLLLSDDFIATDKFTMDEVRKMNPTLHQKVLSLCQDIIYVGSRGKCRTPKHVGLSLAVHQLTQSKDVVSLINKNGHGVSYEEVERIDTSWARQQQTKDGILIPSNMIPGIALRAAGDNFNRATESIDGKHLDIVNMVLFQADSGNIEGRFASDIDEKIANRNKTLKEFEPYKILECPNIHLKQINPVHLLKKVDINWFISCSEMHRHEREVNMTFIELRLMPSKLFEMFIEPFEEKMVGWTNYRACVSLKRLTPKTVIGYCPMIPASATEINTIYTMMKVFQKMFRSLGQLWTYVTYDEAIYSKAQMIKWRNFDEFKDDEMEMGGMHRAMNFMGDVGRVMEDSGFEDIIVEANIYGPSTLQVIMKGKAYNRGVRLHKLMNEAFNRLKWNAFEKWLNKNNIHISDEEKSTIAKDIISLRGLLKSKVSCVNESDEVSRALNLLMEHSSNLNHLMRDFTTEGCNLSHTFKYWNMYVSELSQLLLDFIAAKRSGNRDLELETFAEMIPYDFACGHTNYARWGTVHVIEGNLLRINKPGVHEIISKEHSAVYRSNKPFTGVWHDMAIEQSINKDCGKFKQLYTNEEALQKFYLIAHRKAEVTTKMKEMSCFLLTQESSNKEASSTRLEKDEIAIKKIVDVVQLQMVNPFEVDNDANEDDKMPLINIATSVVANPEVQKDMGMVMKIGQDRMKDFVENRIQNGTVDFMAPIPKKLVKTFNSMNKTMSVKVSNTVKSMNIDRQIFSKLAVVAQSRDVDIRKVLKYELTPVPLSLFNLDGSMRKTTKSVTMSLLEGKQAQKTLPNGEQPQLLVIDFMMLIRMLLSDRSKPMSFGDLTSKVMSLVLKMQYEFTALVCDNYQTSLSIKAAERSRRGIVQMQEIRNPKRETPIPKMTTKFLSNQANKLVLADFIYNDLMQSLKETLPVNMTVFLGGGFKDARRALRVNKDCFNREEHLESDHEEADSRMFVHIEHAVKQLGVNNIVLWSCDSDVAAICPRIAKILNIKLFFKTGTQDHKRYIPMHNVASELGDKMSDALPVIHALSGCDSTSSFFGLGKRRWFSVLEKNQHLLEGIMDIGNDPIVISETANKSVNQAVSFLYCGKELDNTDEARYDLFSKKGLCSEKLPPTYDSLRMHIKRVNYQAYIWKYATRPYLNLPSPVNNGWTIDGNGNLVTDNMTQAPAPSVLLDFTKCSCRSQCHTKRCSCLKEGLFCTDACHCDNESCTNRIECSNEEESDEEYL